MNDEQFDLLHLDYVLCNFYLYWTNGLTYLRIVANPVDVASFDLQSFWFSSHELLMFAWPVVFLWYGDNTPWMAVPVCN